MLLSHYFMMGDFIMVRARADDELHVKKKPHLLACIKIYKVYTSGEINSSDKEALQVSDIVTQNSISIITQTYRRVLPSEKFSC